MEKVLGAVSARGSGGGGSMGTLRVCLTGFLTVTMHSHVTYGVRERENRIMKCPVCHTLVGGPVLSFQDGGPLKGHILCPDTSQGGVTRLKPQMADLHPSQVSSKLWVVSF